MKREEIKEIEAVINLVEQLIDIIKDQQRQVAELTARVINLEDQTCKKDLLQQQSNPTQ